jgi:formylglycine-generating enzyme required for sulfatase activity
MPLTLRRTLRKRQGYIESLLDARNAIPLQMLLVPGNTFTMGCPKDEEGYEDIDGPQHEVTVPAFFMGRYPVTQAQYESLMGTNPAAEEDADRFAAPNNPVINVSWEDAISFCDRLAELTGRPYRLPSEAEWEYACRAGTTTPFYFGKTLTTEVANYNGESTYADGPQGEYREALTPVDHFGIANAFGLSDMHGNVREWCQDVWHGSYKGAPVDGSAWMDSEKQEKRRVTRGGSWFSNPSDCRSAYRYYDDADFRFNFIGFRVVCAAPRA